MATILVVDDRPINREFMSTLLGYSSHHVLEAADGLEALAIVRAERPDLIIADILMPTMDGYELVRTLRSDPSIADIPVIFYTATYHEKEANSLAASCNVQFVLNKPSEPELIMATVNKALGSRASPSVGFLGKFPVKDLGLLTDALQETLKESKRTTVRLAALTELGLELASKLTVADLMETFTRGARDVIVSKYAAVGIFSKDRLSLRAFWMDGMDQETILALGTPLPHAGLVGSILTDRLPIRSHDPEHVNPIVFTNNKFFANSFLGVPLFSREDIFGWLCFVDKIGEDRFSHEDERLAVTLASQFAVWYQNALLHDELERHSNQLESEINQRNQAEEMLRKLSNAVEQSEDTVLIANKDGVIEYVNPAFERITGYSRQEAIGKTPRILKSGVYDEKFYEGLWRTILSGRVFRCQFTNRKKNGERLYEEQTITPIKNKDGQITHFVSTGKDITERKKADAVLKETEERYRGIFENSIDGIYQISASGKLLAANPSLARILGYDSAEKLLESIKDIRNNFYVDPGSFEELLRLLEEQRNVQGFETEVYRKDRNIIWISQDVRTANRRNGARPFGPLYEAFVKDITERKQAQQVIKPTRLLLFTGLSTLLLMAGVKAIENFLIPIQDFFPYKIVDIVAPAILVVIASYLALRKQQVLYKQKLEEITERQKAEEALRVSEEKFRQIAENISEVFWMSNKQITQMLYISPAYEKIWGRSCQSLYDRPMSFVEAIHPEDREATLKDLNVQMKTGTFDSEYRIIRPDGSFRWIWARGFPIRNTEGEVIRVAGIAQDITLRRETEEALRQSEERLRFAFEDGPMGMALVNQDFQYIAVNKAYSEMLGYTLEELKGMTFPELTHPDDVEKDIHLASMLFENKIPSYQIQKRYLRKNGEAIWVQLTAALIHDASGKPSYAFAMIENIHQKKQAEERLEAQHKITNVLAESQTLEEATPKILQTLSEILDCEFSTIWRVDRRRNVLQCVDVWNRPGFVAPEFEEITKTLEFEPGAGLSGSVWSKGQPDWISDISKDLNFPPTSSAVKAGLRSAFAFPIISAKVITGVVEFFCKEIREPDTAIVQMFSSLATQIGQYIERKHSEETKAELEKQLLQSQKMEAIGQLAGGVAHDFNNTLMALSGYSELMLMQMPQENSLRRIASEIQKTITQGANLTRQLLAFSRRQVLMPKILDLNQSVSNIENMLRRLIGEDVELSTVFAKDLGYVKADPGQVEQVLMNLAVNARDAMPQGGKLTIETLNVDLEDRYAKSHLDVKTGSYVLLAVSDTGCGMDEETMSHIFEPFYTTKEEGKGTGLGLSTVYGIVKQSDGHISVYSQTGHGTTFKIYFPRLDGEGLVHHKTESVSTDLTGRGETVLLVDDNDAVRNAIGEVLGANGYTVVEAKGAEDAIETVNKHSGSIDLLVSDIVMPGMSGFDLAHRVRGIYRNIKVLFMSGYTEEAINRQGILEPGSMFIAKPVTMQVLLAKIREILAED